MKNIELPKQVTEIIKTLNDRGHEAFIVGGCVRDAILGRVPKDWDIATSATPAEIKASFPHTYDTGIQHGTVTVVIDGENFEVTTYRIEGAYLDYRRPSSVTFTDNLKEDLRRRDFTINAMAYHPQIGLVDPFDGQMDLKNRCIRGVGVPRERFLEDALRMLRGVRFSVQLDFFMEEHTRLAILELAPLLQQISIERVREELEKTFLCQTSSNRELLFETGLLEQVSPWFSQMAKAYGDNLSTWLSQTTDSKILCWTVLLQGGTAKEGKEFLKYLKYDNKTIRDVTLLLENLHIKWERDAYFLRKLLSRLGTAGVEALLAVSAILYPKESWKDIESQIKHILETGECFSLGQLAVTGQDMQDIGIPRGKQIGEALAHLLEQVLLSPEKNQRQWLLEYAKDQFV